MFLRFLEFSGGAGLTVATVLTSLIGSPAATALDAPGVLGDRETLEESPSRVTPPVVLEGRISVWEPRTGPGEPRVLVLEVDEVVTGFVAGSSLVIRVPSDRELPLEPFLQTGKRFRLELRRRVDGELVLRGGYRIPDLEGVSLPGGLIAVPEPPPVQTPRSSADDLSSVQAAATSAITFEERVAELVNQRRLENGNLPPLKHDALLGDSSELHSSNMAQRDFFAHCDLDTKTLPGDRMADAGYFWFLAGENIAAGHSTPEDVMTAWMGSSGHRANILSTSFRELGVGYVLQSGDTGGVRFDQNGDCVSDGSGGPFFRYWTQNFGSRSGVFPVVIEREAHETDQQTVDLYVYGAGWAQEMRFSNDRSTWSAWEGFSSNRQWNLSSGNGTKTVWAQLRNGTTVREASDTILFAGACTVGQDQIELTNQTLGGTQTFEACVEVLAHSGVHVSGDAIFQAGERVVLGDGFSVASGASFQAVIQVP